MSKESDSDKSSWRGCSLLEIHNGSDDPYNHCYWPTVEPSDNHTVLYELSTVINDKPPKPIKGVDKWELGFVRLPCSEHNKYRFKESNGSEKILSRWNVIRETFSKPISSSEDLESAIKSYNNDYSELWNFKGLRKFFFEMDQSEAEIFFTKTLPHIIKLALQLPNIVSSEIPLLKQGHNKSISMSQQQVACLLANAFLCTFPNRIAVEPTSEYKSFPDINFNRLFSLTYQRVIEKLKCICHFFHRVIDDEPAGVITFTRRFIHPVDLPKWPECDNFISSAKLHISTKTMECLGDGLLQVDFANRLMGGGILGAGSVQEEIRFATCPELIVSRLFVERLKSTEALFIIGAEQYSQHLGYADTFVWNGNYTDNAPIDDSGRRKNHIVAIDALRFTNASSQYRSELMLRELNKAYAGFMPLPNDNFPISGIVSGNWGCGAFRGNPDLKALLQLMVCCLLKRPLIYSTFGDKILMENFYEMYSFLSENNFTVAQLWKYLCDFSRRRLPGAILYSFIYQEHNGS